MADRPRSHAGIVVGTAGHIDHGKTSLIRALTGEDTDRLPEEKRRGISIDLGFAHLDLGGGQVVSFIDVPGHERFVRNMLAGAAGMQAVMLIVAATEGVMPQTCEHFEICRLLNLKHGFVVLTKADIAAPEQIAAAENQIRALCSRSFLQDAPIVQVSSHTGSGMDAVKGQLRRLFEIHYEAKDVWVPRLWIDRSFVKKGFGTVVTGTLGSGTLRVGDGIHIYPKQKSGRIRSMQTHGSLVDLAIAGQRTALNLSGIDSAEAIRGNALTIPSAVRDSFVVDAALEWLNSAELPEGRTSYLFHIGSAEMLASVKVLEIAKAGAPSLVRIWTPQPVLAFPGDRFVLRRPSPAFTVAGGAVVDIMPPLRLNRARTLHRLQVLLNGNEASRLALLVEEAPTGRTVLELQRATGFTIDHILSLARSNPDLLVCEPQLVITKAWLGERRNRLANWLASFHRQNPSAPGAPLAQARLGLRPELAAIVFEKNPALRINGGTIALATHKAVFSDQDAALMGRIELAFRSGGFQPPAIGEVLPAISRDPQKARSLLEVLLKNKQLIRIADDVIFHAEVVTHVRNSLAAHRGRRFSVPEFKEWTQMSRKYAIPMLEYLDRERVTRRDGDQRLIL